MLFRVGVENNMLSQRFFNNTMHTTYCCAQNKYFYMILLGSLNITKIQDIEIID